MGGLLAPLLCASELSTLESTLAARVDAAERDVDVARAAAQDRDPATGKPSRPINRAPEELQEAYRDAGVDRFVYMGCDVIETLSALMREEGVLQ